MRRSLRGGRMAEELMLSGLAFVCYSATLASLIAVGYLLSALASGFAGRQIIGFTSAFASVAS